MPKASKKKKQEKAQDFKKVKLKVGKKKAPANNFTDTSFSSKAIVLTGQSITQDKSSELTNTRNLTLDELLVQLKHYSATVRKDAVAGIRDLLNLHPHLLHLQLGSIVNASIRLVTDNDPSVRKDFLRFYEYILERVAETDLTPFVSMIVAFTCAGLTHILDDIRGDALRFLDQLVASFPRLLSGYSDTIMPNFFSLLATSTEATQAGGSGAQVNTRTSLLSQGSRLTILRTCYNYIKACISTDTTAERRRFWFLDTDELPKFDAGAAKNWSDPRGNSGALAQDPTPYYDPSASESFAYLGLFSNASPSSDKRLVDERARRRARYAQALTKFYPFLQASWMELAPPLFGAASTILADQTLDTCRFILETFKALWRSAEPTFKCDSDESSDKLIAFARQCMLYFPFGSSVLGACDSQVNAVLLEMNLAVSELVSLIVTAVESSDPKIIRERQRWKSRVTNYVLTLLGAKQRGDGGTCSMVANLQSGQVVDLLLTLWKLCKDGSKKDQKLLLESFIRYTHACNVFSESKAIAIEFLALIVKAHTDKSCQTPRNLLSQNPELAQVFADWLASLPKTLWQLKARQPETTNVILQLLCLVLRSRNSALWRKELWDALQASLVPFFYVNIPRKGPVFGPFTSLPSHLQKRAIELLYYCPEISDKLMTALRACLEDFQRSGKQLEVIEYANSTLALKV